MIHPALAWLVGRERPANVADTGEAGVSRHRSRASQSPRAELSGAVPSLTERRHRTSATPVPVPRGESDEKRAA